MQAHQQVEVGRDDPDLDDLGTFLTGDPRDVICQIGGEWGIDQRFAFTSRPNDVHEQAMAHART